MRPNYLALAMLLASTAVAAAQSPKKGRVLIDEDFSSGVVDTNNFSNDSWDVPETWQLRDGAMLRWENSWFSVDASVRITLIDRDVPSYS
jgi:hypothetical protein